MKKILLLYSILVFQFCFSQSQNVIKESVLGSNSIFIYSGILLSLVVIVFWKIWRRNKKIFNKNISTGGTILLERPGENKDPNNLIEETEKNYSISSETANIIVKKLVRFEKDQKFLKKDITLTWVANYMNTNTKYLSETIKIYRGKNFNGYINGLRISYITHMLYKKPEYREYKIVALAKECGYSSSQVFVIAFKKENGIPPSYFIDNLKSSETKASLP